MLFYGFPRVRQHVHIDRTERVGKEGSKLRDGTEDRPARKLANNEGRGGAREKRLGGHGPRDTAWGAHVQENSQ